MLSQTCIKALVVACHSGTWWGKGRDHGTQFVDQLKFSTVLCPLKKR